MKTFEKNLNSVRILLALRLQRKTTGHVNPDKFSKVIVIYVCMHVCVCEGQRLGVVVHTREPHTGETELGACKFKARLCVLQGEILSKQNKTKPQKYS